MPQIEECLNIPLKEALAIIQDRTMFSTRYFGVKAIKNPLDCWVYQEIIHETKPDVIVEIGTGRGGGTLFLAHLCTLLGMGRVISIDLSHTHVPKRVKDHPRISLIEGDACQQFKKVKDLIGFHERVLIIEDSSHEYSNTLRILQVYSPLIKSGDYFIVEDSICNHGVSAGPKPGSYEAIEEFIKKNPDFESDRSRESFLITWNLKGYLRRK